MTSPNPKDSSEALIDDLAVQTTIEDYDDFGYMIAHQPKQPLQAAVLTLDFGAQDRHNPGSCDAVRTQADHSVQQSTVHTENIFRWPWRAKLTLHLRQLQAANALALRLQFVQTYPAFCPCANAVSTQVSDAASGRGREE